MQITIETRVKAPIADVWQAWITPADICQWNTASPDWHTPSASVDFRVGGKFVSRMEAKDGSMGFDFEGVYTRIDHHAHIECEFGDRRLVVTFTPSEQGVLVSETFDAEDTHSEAEQRQGWQAILDSFARHVEGKTTA